MTSRGSRALLVGALLWTGCGDDGDPRDAGPGLDSGAPDARTPDGGEPDAELPPVEVLPLDPGFDEGYEDVGDAVVTTLVETRGARYGLRLYLDDFGRSRVPLDEFGRTHPQPGERHRLRDQLAIPESERPTWEPGALPEGRRSALYSFLIGDPQLVDVDSPAQLAKNLSSVLSNSLPAHRPHGELIPHLTDALIRSANRFSTDERPLDVVLALGDLLENAQANELAWFATTMSGGELSIDSGARDDVVPGPGNDAFDPWIAEGLADGVPWLVLIGNHDLGINGNFPPGLIREANEDPAILAALEMPLRLAQLTLPAYPTSDHHPAWYPHELRAAFRTDMDAFTLEMLPRRGELRMLEPRDGDADEARAPVDTCGFVTAFREASGAPAGHGYTSDNEADCTAWYTFEPVAGVPLRIVSLSFGPVEGGAEGIFARPYTADGEIDAERRGDPRWDQVAFLEAELARAAEDGVAVIVMSHQASEDIVLEPSLSRFLSLAGDDPVLLEALDRWVPTPPEAVSPEELRAMLAGSGVVVAHVAGHNHRNRVRAVCPDGTVLASEEEPRCAPGGAGEPGYWEITTVGTVSFPHQGRFLELVHVEGRLAALYLTMLDPRIPSGSFAELGRFLSKAWEATKGEGGAQRVGAPGDRNVLLPVWLAEDVAVNLAAAPLRDRVESETTLLQRFDALPSLPEFVD